jgi:hypothetical protein
VATKITALQKELDDAESTRKEALMDTQVCTKAT